MISTHDIAWLAGLLEGEGCFFITPDNAPVISLAMSDKDIIEKAQDVMGKFKQIRISRDARGSHWKTMYNARCYGILAIGWMMTIYQFLGRRRREKIREVITQWKTTPARSQFRDTCRRGHLFVVPFKAKTKRSCRICARAYQENYREQHLGTYRQKAHRQYWQNPEKYRARSRANYWKGKSGESSGSTLSLNI